MALEIDHEEHWDFDNVTLFTGAIYLMHRMDMEGKSPQKFEGALGPMIDEFIHEYISNNDKGTARMTEIAEDVNLMLGNVPEGRVH